MFNGAFHKRWLIGNAAQATGYNLIEGVGADGLVEYMAEYSSDKYKTVCLKVNNKAVYPDGYSCETITGIFENKHLVNQISIFPNPSNGSFTICAKEDMTSLRICDLLGKIIHNQKINNQSTYKVNDLPKGTYILTIFDKNDQETNQKIIVCD